MSPFILPCLPFPLTGERKVYQFKSSRMVSIMLRLICVSLGCDMPTQPVLSSEYDDLEIVSSCTDSRHRLAMRYVTFYA